MDSDIGYFEVIDSLPTHPKCTQTNTACNTPKPSYPSNNPACPSDKGNKTALGDCTNTKYNAKSSKKKFRINHKLYTNDVRVAFVPHNINDNVKYVIKCNETDWHSKQKDGHHWVTTCGKNMKLKWLHRVSKCKGPLECTNKSFPHYLCQRDK